MERTPHEGGEAPSELPYLVAPDQSQGRLRGGGTGGDVEVARFEESTPDLDESERTRVEPEQPVGAVVVGQEIEYPTESGDQDDESDPFFWDDAAHWSPAEVVASQIEERQFTAEESDALLADGTDEEIGAVDELGWYGLIRRRGRTGGFILRQDEQGLRQVRETDSNHALEHASRTAQHEYEHFYEERDAYERATAEAAVDSSNPRIWVASLADYTAGRLYGVWMDATCEADDLVAATRFMLRGSSEDAAEEWGIFDYDGFHGYEVGEYASFATVSRIAQGIAEHGEPFAAWVNCVGVENEELLSDEGFRDRYLGRFESMKAYVENLLEEAGDYAYLNRLPEHLRPYISVDVEQMARDYEAELYVVEARDGGVHLFDAGT